MQEFSTRCYSVQNYKKYSVRSSPFLLIWTFSQIFAEKESVCVCEDQNDENDNYYNTSNGALKAADILYLN